MSLADALRRLVPDESRVSDGDSILDAHAGDMTYHRPSRPDAVVFPTTTAEVASILRYASDEGVPVVPFGVGTSLEGHVIPLRGGISLDLMRMDKVLAVQPADLTAIVQPGVTREALNRAAGEHGLFFPVDPGADASLGGMAATNASGTTTVRYGGMRTHVLALEVVLADGSVVRTGTRARKTSAGFDLTSLFVGSEGTLGVITELTLRLHGIPEHVVAARLVFDDVESACRTAAALVATGVAVTRAELLDATTIDAINAYKGTSFESAPTLFLEFAGTLAGVDGDLDSARELAELEAGRVVAVESDPTGRARLWEARHHVFFALVAGTPGTVHKATDVCVPVSELAGAIHHARTAIDDRGLRAAIVAHAGDGNYHVLFMLDPDDPTDVERAESLNAELVEWALAHGGTCSGEHGIGLGKISYLEREHGDLVPLMLGIKRLLDPQHILNPGKVLREPDA